MSYGMIFAIAVVLLLGWLHSSRKEAARQDVDSRIVPAVLDAVLGTPGFPCPSMTA